MSNGLDITELNIFNDQLLGLAQQQFPSETKKFLRKEGTNLNKKVKAVAKSRVGKNGKGKKSKPAAKRYLSGFKRGKVYRHAPSDSYAVRVYNSRPHAHLIEYGHRQLDKEQKPVKNGKKFVPARPVLEDAARAFEPDFEHDVDTFINELLEKGLSL